MAKMLVMGSLDFTGQKQGDFIKFLGQEIVSQGHKLLTSCRSELDTKVAESAFNFLKGKGLDIDKQMLSYVDPDREPAHNFGTILKSRCRNWGSLASPGLEIPETIREADVVLIIGGKDGTNCAANWARISGKPLMPITVFGGSAGEIYELELKDFDEKYSNNILRSDYEILNQVSADLNKIAKDSVSLAARVIASNQVFILMSYTQRPDLIDAYDSFREVCKEFGYDGKRVDDTNAVDRIVPEVLERIRKAAFGIVDLSEPKPNVYYELGIAQGLEKPVIITAKTGTDLPFDVADIPTILWDSQKGLKERLKERIVLIAPMHGRS